MKTSYCEHVLKLNNKSSAKMENVAPRRMSLFGRRSRASFAEDTIDHNRASKQDSIFSGPIFAPRKSIFERLPQALFSGARRASAVPMEERYSKTMLADASSFIIFTAPSLRAADQNAMLQKLAKGEVTMGRAGTEEALQGRLTSQGQRRH